MSVLSKCPARWLYCTSWSYTFAAQIVLNILVYLDCAYSPTKHLHFACSCQQKGRLSVTHEGTSHPSQRTGRDGIFVIPVSDKRIELYHSFSKKKKNIYICMVLPRRLWNKAENLKMKECGKLIINITTSAEEILLFITPSQLTRLCYTSLVWPFMHACNFPSGK